MANGTLQTRVKYGLGRVVPLPAVHGVLGAWSAGGWRKTALALYVGGSLGKAEFACAPMINAAPAKAFHAVKEPDRSRGVVFGPWGSPRRG